MARNEQEVLLGPGYLYVAPHTAGAPEPPPTFDTAMTLDEDPGGNWEDVGFTEDGWAIAGQNTFSYWTPAELVDPIVTVKDEAEYHLRGVLAQFTLENLQIALSGGTITQDAAGTADTTPALRHYVPAESSEFAYFSALFITQKGDFNFVSSENCVRMTYVPFVISAAEAEIPHTKGANPSLLGIDLRAIKGPGVDIIRIDEQVEV